MRKFILYSNDCPRCKMLKTMLDELGLNYEVEDNMDVIKAKGFLSMPMLVGDDGSIMSFDEAVIYLNKLR